MPTVDLPLGNIDFLRLFWAARFRPAVWNVVQTTRLRLLRHSPPDALAEAITAVLPRS